ncbi:hypothetical protein [Dactylosporangium sp. CA-233914]|uniref:hypothetical protein n=1 Tax=Dactylosporangium sp. CA-233914 TaxID=3239934 RepID=UPI003D8DB042
MTATLEEVRRALQDNTDNGRIDLAAAAGEEPLDDLRPALAVLHVGQGYPLTGVQPPIVEGGRVLLRGYGSFGLRGARTDHVVAVVADLEYTIVEQRGCFTLTLALPADWTFGDTFANLPSGPRLVEQIIRRLPSYLSDLPLHQAALRARTVEGATDATLHLLGELQPAEAYERYEDFFAPWPLAVDGTVVLPASAADPPDLDLVATSRRPAITAGPVRLHGFGLQLLCFSDREKPVGERVPGSVLNAVATLELGGNPPIAGRAFAQLLVADAVWIIMVEFEGEGPTLGDGFAGVARAFGLAGAADFTAPPGVHVLTGFQFRELEAGLIAPDVSALPSLNHVAVTLVSPHRWTLPVPFLSVSDLGMSWMVGWQGEATPEYLVGGFFGRLHLPTGPGPHDEVVLGLSAFFPSFRVNAELREGEIPLEAMLARFLGVPPPSSGLTVTQLSIGADLTARTVEASAWLTRALRFELLGKIPIELVGVGAWISAGQNSISGGLRGELALPGLAPPGAAEPLVELTATYDGQQWIFQGGLTPDSIVDLAALVAHFTGAPRRRDFELLLTELAASFAMGTGAFALSVAIATRWTPEILGGLTIAAAAGAQIARTDAQSPASARLTGRFQVAGFALSITADMTAGEVTYVFEVSFNDHWIAAEIAWIGEGDQRHQIITIHVGNVTVGEIIEYLVGLVAPTLGFRLEPPWDLLNRIDLSRFRLVIDPTLATVEVTYQATVVLPTMTLTGIGLRAQRVAGKPTVVMILHRAEQAPLSWDLLSDPPPRVAGEGPAKSKLNYLGIGQRVRLKGDPPTTVREAIARLATQLRPPDDPDTNPLDQPSGEGLQFAAEAGWLVGLDISVAGLADIALVLADPDVYGLAVSLSGEKADAFAGLRFDVLYRKVSGNVGVFRAELELPESVRRFQLGAVSVTLGVLVVEVFTNGDFRVDLGFPHGGDFGRSFAFEVLPLLGRGGILVGKLDAATSGRVPAISNGTFSPVLELGIGFAVGIGKEFRAGPVSGGAYVEVVAIFDGVFAWFNPTDAGAPTDVYHWVSAVVGVHGKLYGQLDLSVLKVAVTIEAWAEASITLEAYRATDVQVSFSVEVNAELTIGTFTIPLSFSDSVPFGFTLGTDRPTPWLLAGGTDQGSQARLRAGIAAPPGRVPRRRLEVLRRLALQRTSRTAAEPWDPTQRVFTNSPRVAKLYLQPLLSVTDVPLAWSAPAPPPSNPPHYRSALLLVAPYHAEPSTRQFVEALLRWSIAAVTGTPGNDPSGVVTAAQLRALADDLHSPATVGDAFQIAKLVAFFRTNLHLDIADQPPPARAAHAAAEPLTGTVLPIPPLLTLASSHGGARHNLAQYHPVGPRYLWQAAQYAAHLTPTPRPPTPPPPDQPATYHSYGTYLFQDWCLMVARAAVDAAVAGLNRRPVGQDRPMSLRGIADAFPTVSVAYHIRAGDTVDSVAAALGASPAELRFLNPELEQALADTPPGTRLPVKLGVSPQSAAIDNAAVPIDATTSLDLGTIDYQVAAGDTLAAIAGRFNSRAPQSLFPAGLTDPLATDRQLLAGYAEFTMPPVRFANPNNEGILLVAAVFFTRYRPLTEVDSAEWYSTAVFNLNAADITWGPGDAVPPGSRLLVPAAYNDADPVRARRYTTLPGDTIASIARALALVQRFGTGEQGPAGWPRFREQVVSAGAEVSIPATTNVPILPRESLADLAERLLTAAGRLDTLLQYVAAQPILAQLAIVPVPDVVVNPAGRTLGWLCDRLGLSLDDLAGRLAEQTLFSAGAPLSIAHLLVHGIDDLVAAVLDDATEVIGARSARNLLSGTRLPAPVYDPDRHASATGPLTAIADLVGQQFPAPAPAGPDNAVALELTVTANADAAGWITLGPAARLVYRYTNADLRERYPAGSVGVTPVIGQGPAERPSAEPVPRTFGLDHRIEIQTPVPITMPPADPTGAAGDDPVKAPPPSGVSAWPLPAALIAYAAGHTSTRFELARAARRPDAPGESELLSGWTFAMLVPLRVRRLAGLTHRYELIGVDAAARDPLQRLWERHSLEPAAVYVAVRPAPDAGHPSGLAVLNAAPARTFVVRANLSKQTAPPAHLATATATVTATEQFADLDAPMDFLRLLWEGSVVGGAGFAIGFAAADGADLPASAFDDNGVAALTLLVLTEDAWLPAPGGRPVRPYETCALIPAGLDPSVTALWLGAADDSAVTVEPVVPQGSAGFGVTLTPPDPNLPAPTYRLRQLFSLVRYAIPDAPFQLPDAGLPVWAQVDDGLRRPRWRRARLDRRRRAGLAVPDEPAADLWRYEQVLPLARFGPASPCPAVPGLPPPDADPYRGVGQGANVHLGLCDVLGNVTTLPGGPNGTARLTLGYTDAVLGVGSWPGITTAYWVDRGPQGVRLRLTVTAEPATIMPGLDGTATAVAPQVARAAERFAQACFQLADGRVQAAVVTSLRQDQDGTPAALPADASGLWRLSAAACLANSAAAAATPVLAGGTIAEIGYRYGVNAALIAAVNADRPAAGLLGTGPVVPAYRSVGDGQSAADVLAGAPVGWPRPGSGSDLLRLPHNRVLPLRAGSVLRTAAVEIAVGPVPAALGDVARRYHTTAGLLATDNAGRTDILVPTFAFEFEGVSIPAGTDSLDQIVARFGELGVVCDVATLGAANADRPGLLAAGARLATTHYVARPDDTIDTNGSGADLAAGNGGTPGIYPAGTLLSLGTFDPAVVRVQPDETLEEFAGRFACPPPQLLAANADRPLPDATVLIPGAVRLPEPGTVRVPYPVRGTDTLAAIAALFPGHDLLTLAQDNAPMPGTLAPGRAVVLIIDDVRYEETTVAGDSLAGLHRRFAAQDAGIALADVVEAIAFAPGCLAAGAVLSTPAPRLPGTGPVSPAAAAAALGSEPVALCLANAAVLGLIQPGVELTAPGRSTSIVTGSDDTLNSLTARFAAIRVTLTVAELVAGHCDTAFLRAAATVLLPPAPVSIAVEFAAAGPFATVAGPLTVALRLRRPRELVDVRLRNGPAEHADTAVPPRFTVDPTGSTDTRTLGPFADAFHTALPDLRLATGSAGEADLWLVNFGAGGLSKVYVGRLPDGTTVPPRSFAIRPLYREPQTRRGVALPALDEQGRLVAGPQVDIQAVDVEVWARRFLRDIDTVLSPAYACGLYADPTARTALDRLLAAKSGLARAVALGVAEVLQPGRATANDLDAARQTIRDRLAVELAPAYDTAALVQYDAQVVSPWIDDESAPARLLGTARPTAQASVPYQLAAAKTALDRSTSPVTFALSVADPTRQSSVPVQVDYDVTHLEHDIHVIGSTGYPSSRWLTFYPPLSGADRPPALRTSLDRTQVPIPLRAYPVLPALVNQSADPTVPQHPTIGDAARWTYAVTYAHEHAAQDEVQLTVAFNVAPQAGPQAPAAADMVTALARYQAVADPLLDLLAAYGGDAVPSDAARAASAANAAVSLATLATEVTGNWLNHTWPQVLPAAPDPLTYRYGISTLSSVEPDGTEVLSVVRVRLGQPVAGPTGEWPVIACRTAEGIEVALVPQEPVDDVRDYRAPVAIPRTAWLTLTMRWPGLHAARFQNARATLSVRRNEWLLGRDQAPTSEPFVFRTADVTAPAPASPLLIRPEPIDIGLDPAHAEVGAALQAALRELTDGADVDVTISAWYSYDLVSSAGATGRRFDRQGVAPLSTRLPVTLWPRRRSSGATGGLVAERLQEWLGHNDTAPAPGRRWLFSVTVHTSLTNAYERPLVVVDQLRYGIFTTLARTR